MSDIPTIKSINVNNTLPIAPTLAMVMMVKNESARICVSLESIKDIVNCVVILDTGSEDDTIKIITKYCSDNNLKLFIMEQTFVPFHFSNARNVLLDFADDKADYLLLLDCNDELKGAKELRQFINSYSGNSSAFHLCQEWWTGTSLEKYYNIRLVKTKHSWRFKGSIHEYITSPEVEVELNNGENHIIRVIGFSIYQDRTKDDDKSSKRFIRDEEILENEYNTNEKPDTRNIFYFAQTCMCLSKNEKAYKLYRERSNLLGFTEERYHSYLRCGELSKLLGHDWEETMNWFLKAYEYSSTILIHPRAEPLFKIAEYYKDKNWEMSFLFLKRCCELPFPDDAILFIDRHIYEYSRWHLMGIVAYYVKQYEIGKIACARAIKNKNIITDKNNMKFYTKNEKEIEDILNNI